MTPDLWAATTLLSSAPWIESDLHGALTPEAAGTIAQRWLADGSYADAHGYVKANAGGVRYSHPGGETGRLSWTRYAELIRGAREPDPQQGLF